MTPATNNEHNSRELAEAELDHENTKVRLEEKKWSRVGGLQDDELDLATGGVRTYGPIMN